MICSVDGCENTVFENGLCAKHNSQMRSYGHILQRTVCDRNEIIIDGDYAYIILYDKHCNIIGKTKIDKKNIPIIKEYKWYLNSNGYVATNNYNGKYKYLHKLICGDNTTKRYVDHLDRNKLNNTEENLRFADGSENQMNKGIRSNNTSGKVGVHFNKQNNKWCAMICRNGKHINLGYFNKYEDAVECRTRAEEEYFGEYRANNEIMIPEV